MEKLKVMLSAVRFYVAYALFLGLFMESLWTISIAVVAEIVTVWFHRNIVLAGRESKVHMIDSIEFSPEEFRRAFMISPHN